MKLEDKITAIKSNQNYLIHTVDITQIKDNIISVFLEYWNTVGNTDEVVGYCKKFLVINHGKENEHVYEDKATPNQVVRARKW